MNISELFGELLAELEMQEFEYWLKVAIGSNSVHKNDNKIFAFPRRIVEYQSKGNGDCSRKSENWILYVAKAINKKLYPEKADTNAKKG